jgi:protein tyrosine/serine phosphatase
MYRVISLVLLLAVVAGGWAAPKAEGPAGIPNFHTVTTNITRGAAPTAEGLRGLKARGVKIIIDLRISPKLVKEEKARAAALGFTWVNIPMGAEPPTQKQVDTFLALLARAPKEPVFVHCQHGADRTGCMIGIYRVQVQGWTYQQAYTEMRKYGFKKYYTKLADAVKKRAKH